MDLGGLCVAVREVQGDEHQCALGDVLGIGAEAEKLHTVGQHAQNVHSHDGLPQRTLAALQCHACQHAGGNAGELDTCAGGGVGIAVTGGEQHGGDTHQQACEGEGQNLDLLHVQTCQTGSLGVIACGIDLTQSMEAHCLS